MRRTRLVTSLIAVVSLAAAGVFILGAPVAEAESVQPGMEWEGWYARSRPADPQVDTCGPGGVLTTPVNPCGPTSPGDVPAPQSKGTGHYVVASAGGPSGDKPQNSGDTGWAAFQWDVLSQFGASIEKFEVTLFQAEPTTSNADQQVRFDTYNGTGTAPPIQACNIIEPWAAEPGSNPWETRPNESLSCVAPTKVEGRAFTFDFTSFATTWVEGSGYGVVLRPGLPSKEFVDQPFQVTFSGYNDSAANAKKPQVTFKFTPAFDDDDFDGGDDGTGGDFFEDVTTGGGGGGSFEAVPELDVIPIDAGSDPAPQAAAPQEQAAPPLAAGPTRPISSNPKFPWLVLLLLPLAAIAFWGTGTALGYAGDPVPARAGGVSRVLAARHAAGGGPTDSDTRY